MEVLYIHAGLPKNGSSALQVFFSKNQDNLRNHDVEYFSLGDIEEGRKGNITSGNGSLLSRSMLNEKHEAFYKNGATLYEEFLDRVSLSKQKVGLLSSEFFAIVPLQNIRKLKEDLENQGVNLKFIFYVRRQDQFLMSGYIQRVKRHGHIGNPNEYLKTQFKKVHFLNYYGYFNELELVLGPENISVSIYENTKEHKKGLVGHFMDTLLGQCPDWVNTNETINTSPSPLEIKLMLIANQYSPRMKFSDFIVEDSIKTSRSTKYKSHNIASPQVVDEVMNYFAEQNNKFEIKYCDGEKFPPMEAKDYIDLDNIVFYTFGNDGYNIRFSGSI